MVDKKNIQQLSDVLNDDDQLKPSITHEEYIRQLEEKNELLENKLNESEIKYKYLLADLDNVRKRNNKILLEKEKYEGENIIKNIIELLDYLDYILANNDISKCDNILDIKTKLLSILSNYGVKLIYNDQRPALYDDLYDDAVSAVETNDKILDNSIYNIVHKGYIFKDKVLRHEEVIVYKYKCAE